MKIGKILPVQAPLCLCYSVLGQVGCVKQVFAAFRIVTKQVQHLFSTKLPQNMWNLTEEGLFHLKLLLKSEEGDSISPRPAMLMPGPRYTFPYLSLPCTVSYPFSTIVLGWITCICTQIQLRLTCKTILNRGLSLAQSYFK